MENHLTQIPITPSQQGTFELREEVVASAGAQDMDTSGYDLSDLEGIEFFWENPQVELDVVFGRPGRETFFFTNSFQRFRDGMRRTILRIVLDVEEDKENSTQTTPVFERLVEPPRLFRKCPSGRQIDNVPEFVYRTLFEYIYCVRVCNIIQN